MSNYDSESRPDFGGEHAGRTLRFSPLQQELLQWLGQHSPSMIEPYVAAMNLLQGPAFPGRVPLVCFCMRDLGNILPQARNVANNATIVESSDDSQITTQDQLSGVRQKARKLLQALRALPQARVTEDDVARWLEEVHKLMKWFSDHHHFSHKQKNWPADEVLAQNVQRFERLLSKFTHTFFGLMQRAEEIVARVSAQGGMPTESDADHLVDVLNWSPEFQRPLLEKLSPAWLQALCNRNVFAEPPTESYWPATKYLARIAGDSPVEVADIFAKIETDNPTIIGDMLKAAQVLPLDLAVSFVPAVVRAAQRLNLRMYLKDANDFCVRLAEGDRPDAAMTLAEALFNPTVQIHQEAPNRDRLYWYKENLKKVVPVLAARRPSAFLRTLCNWLKVAVEAKKQFDRDADYSYLWRAAIEEHEQNRDYDFAGVMVGFVRDGFEVAIQSGQLSLQTALEIVDGFPHAIFKRIRLHLIGEFAHQNVELACETILIRDLFDDYQYKHEYARLVDRRLDLLSPEQRNEWFAWIDEGPDEPDLDHTIESWAKSMGRAEATEEHRQAWVHDWQFEKLHWARAHLEGPRRDFYEKMIAERGVSEIADMNVRISSGWMTDESPMTVEQMAAMTFEQVVEAISFWRPERSQFTGPSITGLGSTFEQYVATKGEEFSPRARVMIDRPAIFVRGFLQKMTDSIAAGCHIELPAVLDLCEWVVQRPIAERTVRPEMYDRPVDQDWQWTRDEITRLIATVCTAKRGDAPLYALEGLRQRIWGLIALLYRDSAESYIVHDISKEDPRSHDFLLRAINSPRGKAVAAALEYARWIANHIKVHQGKQEIIVGGFNAMPEVREMLEWQIVQENRSFEALAVIGSRMGLVYWIDQQWLVLNADRLFRLEDIEREPATAHGWGAWNAFLVCVRPHFEYYRIFKPQFAYAVEQAGMVKLAERTPEQPMHHLGEHLMLVYGRGQLGLDDDGGVLRRFVENANADVRRHAIGFVGQSLQGDEKIPKAIVARFQVLWDLYWAGPGRKDAKESPNAWLFGTWFSSGKFPESWALDRLEQFVEINAMPEPDHEIVEKLAELAHVDIAQSVRILNKMVRGDRDGWRIDGWRDSAKRILRDALASPGEARDVAEGLIDYLGRRGYMDFGTLLL